MENTKSVARFLIVNLSARDHHGMFGAVSYPYEHGEICCGSRGHGLGASEGVDRWLQRNASPLC